MTIKQTPEDFQVEERLTDAALRPLSPRPGEFALYRLTKRGLSTPEAIERLCRALRVRPEAVTTAGLKDKYATTIQHVTAAVSALRRSGGPAHLPLRLPAHLEGPHWQAELLGYLPQAISGAAIAANYFRLAILQLSASRCRLMDGAADLLTPPSAKPGTLLVANYFGSQRFGTMRHGQGFLARRLIAGQFEEALKLAIATPSHQDRPAEKELKRLLAHRWGDWKAVVGRLGTSPVRPAVERLARDGDFRAAFAALPYFVQQINVEAYQSYLWNAIASAVIVERCPPNRVWEGDDPLGLMRFAAADSIPPDLVDLKLPLLAPKTKPAAPWAQATENVLHQEGLLLKDLRIPGMCKPFFGQTLRRLFARCMEFSMSRPEKDPAAPANRPYRRVLSFSLPRGAYATVVLRALGQ